jgi:hypothetical protein
MEIELNWLTSYLISHRGEVEKGLEVKRDKIIDNLQKLRASLPDKEANDMSDDEKSIAMIHESYLKEYRLRHKGHISRIFSPEAIALAPALTHKVDPAKLLTKLGYNLVDVVQAADKFYADHELPDSPEAMLEFFGFYLREKYAMPYDQNILDEDEGIEHEDEPVSTGKSPPKPTLPEHHNFEEEESESDSSGEDYVMGD